MKRFLHVIIAVLLLFTGIAAFADNADLKSLSDDELLSLYENVREEIATRGLSTVRSLRSGKYIVGKDILPGFYRLTCTGTEGEDIGNAYASLGNAYGDLIGDGWGSLMDSLGSMMGSISETKVKIVGDYGTELNSVSMKTGDSCTITLSEGTALEVSDGSVRIEAE